jgi:hypothetical protein
VNLSGSGTFGGGQVDGAGGPVASPIVCARFIQLFADTTNGIIEFSFDGINVHGELKNSDMPNLGVLILEDRHESGICLRTKPAATNCVYRIMAW